MSILPIIKYPNPRLRKISSPVTVFDEELALLAENMKETMLAAPGAGLAAPQVDHLIRMIVIDGTNNPDDYGQLVITLINPEILKANGEQIYHEGCLSVLDLQADVTRAETVEVKAQDINGQFFTLQAEGRQAVILQHEIDHLDGILFLDHINRLKREMYKKRITKKQKMDTE